MRFVSFAFVGGLGVFVHMVVLAVLLKLLGLDFGSAQWVRPVLRWCSTTP